MRFYIKLLSCFQNIDKGGKRTFLGKLFYNCGAVMEKARSYALTKWVSLIGGTVRGASSCDLNFQARTYGRRQAFKYTGSKPRRALSWFGPVIPALGGMCSWTPGMCFPRSPGVILVSFWPIMRKDEGREVLGEKEKWFSPLSGSRVWRSLCGQRALTHRGVGEWG